MAGLTFKKMAQILEPHTESSHLVPSGGGSSEKQGKGWEEARSSAPSQPFRTTCERGGWDRADRTLLLVLRGMFTEQTWFLDYTGLRPYLPPLPQHPADWLPCLHFRPSHRLTGGGSLSPHVDSKLFYPGMLTSWLAGRAPFLTTSFLLSLIYHSCEGPLGLLCSA